MTLFPFLSTGHEVQFYLMPKTLSSGQETVLNHFDKICTKSATSEHIDSSIPNYTKSVQINHLAAI